MGRFLNSPIVILPIVATALGLSLVPFAVWGTDHAAQFYGSFFAAIVAAIAAFSGYFIQNKLTEAREEKSNKAKHTSDIVELFFWLRYTQASLTRAERILEKRLNQDSQPDNDEEPFFRLNAIARKAIALTGVEKEAKIHASKALNLPPKARIVVAGRMYDVCDVAEDLRGFFDRRPNLEFEFSAKNIKSMKNIIIKQKTKFESATDTVRSYLEKIGALDDGN